MRKLLTGICLGLAALQLSSCSEDFDVAAPYKDITVVYGLLNLGDTVQYVRIQKAYMDQNRSALEVAKIPDSNFYNNIEVSLRALQNNVIKSSQVLTRVDLNTLGFQKEPGNFFTSPNYAYRIGTLNKDYDYRLVIVNKTTGDIDSAITKVIDTSRALGAFPVNEFLFSNQSLNFSYNSSVNKYTLTVNNASPNIKYVEGYIRFKYVTKVNNVQYDSSFVWRFASAAVAGSSSTRLEVATNQLFPVVRSNIAPADPTQARYIDSADVFVWAADANYYNYLVANQVQGGITADQIKPIYTTIQGKDALGLFGSRAMRISYNVPFNDATVDSLIHNINTGGLGFVGRSDH